MSDPTKPKYNAGIAQAARLTPEQRIEAARAAAKARWDPLTPEQRSAWRRQRPGLPAIKIPVIVQL